MDAQAQAEVWQSLDRTDLTALATAGPRPVFASISGAHLYGFASKNSDVDLRGAFVRPARELLGLRQPEHTLSRTEERRGIEVDWVSHDLAKFARMMTSHNGYVLEQLFSPLVVIDSGALDELRELGRGCVTVGLHRHYRGFANGRRKLLRAPGATVKHLLYAYRVYLTGIFALQTGEVEAHLPTLDESLRVPAVAELVARKRAGAERELLEAGEIAAHEALLDELEAKLDRAAEASHLPETATSFAGLDAFVVRTRLAA